MRLHHSLAIIGLLTAACGGGGGGGDSSEPKQCPTPGYSLYCPNVPGCCPDGSPYACGVPIVGGEDPVACSPEPCKFGQQVLDFCEEE